MKSLQNDEERNLLIPVYSSNDTFNVLGVVLPVSKELLRFISDVRERIESLRKFSSTFSSVAFHDAHLDIIRDENGNLFQQLELEESDFDSIREWVRDPEIQYECVSEDYIDFCTMYLDETGVFWEFGVDGEDPVYTTYTVHYTQLFGE